jgi:assimilatory nitrate reductase catalytic subunit
MPVRTTCPYCGVGCGIIASPQPDGSVTVEGDKEHPSNFGRLCSKGAALGETLSLDGRLLHPEIEGRRASWDEALDLVANSFARVIAEHGPDAVAIYGSGQLLTEDYYVANKLMKGFIGSANIDTNSRLCMASTVVGHKRAFGSDTVPGNYEDLELADLVVLVGSNLAWCHPVIYQRIAAAKAARPNMQIVVIDPRRTLTTEIAELHLPIQSDGDAALFVGLLRELHAAGEVDTDYVATHVEGLDEALTIAEDWPVARVAEATGVAGSTIAEFYRLFAASRKVVTVFSQGVNQSAAGSDKVNAIINCHLATGRIGQPGMGPFSVTGQPNAMGGREVGGLASMLAAHMDFTPDAVDRVGRFWNSTNVATSPGLLARDLFDAVAAGKVKALWIMATNPVDSMPAADEVRAALRACPFVVVSDMSRRTDTIAEAHVKLPAAGWGEKDGTVTNSERRISRQRPFLPLPGDARPDWWIVAQVAQRMGFAGFDYSTASDIFAEHAALSAFENNGTRDFDLSGLVGADYDEMPPVQWPVRKHGTPRLFGAGRYFTKSGKARILPIVPPPPLQPLPGRLLLNTGRVRDHWHTMTRTGKTPRLSSHLGEPFAELHPDDARKLGIRRATLVRIANAQGAIIVRALVTERQRRGHAFVPMHWTEQFASNARVDVLLPPKVDPYSGQPALKMGEVTVEPARTALYGFLVAQEAPEKLDADYWALAPARGGVRIELGFAERPADVEGWVRATFGLRAEASLLRYSDPATGRMALALIEDQQLRLAFYAAPEPVLVSRTWAADLLTARIGSGQRAAVLAGRPGADMPDPGPTVCACFTVGRNTIEGAVRDGCLSVEQVGKRTKAGTNCGSCKIELQGILDRLATAVASD